MLSSRHAIRYVLVLLGVLLGASVSASGVTYSYDALGRLIYATYDVGSQTSYTLDAAGNRKSVVQSLTTTPPAAPTGLAGTATSATNINLAWNACTDSSGPQIVGYKIYRAGAQIGTSTSVSYSDSTVVAKTTYAYTVACYDNAGNTSAQSSPPVSVTSLAAPPSVPTGLGGTAPNQTTVNLTWTASTDTGGPGLAGYKIYRAGAQIGTSTTASYSDTTVSGGTTYSYTVASYDTAGSTSAQSSAVNVTTPSSIPSVPGTPSPRGIVSTKTWTESWGASTGPVAYYILTTTGLSSGPGTWNITAPATTSAQSGTNTDTYDYQVQACNSSNQCSAWSAVGELTVCVGGTCP